MWRVAPTEPFAGSSWNAILKIGPAVADHPHRCCASHSRGSGSYSRLAIHSSRSAQHSRELQRRRVSTELSTLLSAMYTQHRWQHGDSERRFECSGSAACRSTRSRRSRAVGSLKRSLSLRNSWCRSTRARRERLQQTVPARLYRCAHSGIVVRSPTTRKLDYSKRV